MGRQKKQQCYLYLRVSTEMQVDGYSLSAQRDRMLQEAERRDLTVAAEFSDEGKSGKNTTERPAFQEMMDKIKSGNPDGVAYVLVFKLSRFGRNAADVLDNLEIMKAHEINLICVDDGIDSSTDAGKLVISLLSAVAEIERENIRSQSKAGRLQKAREGKWNGGPAPLGYKIVKDVGGRNGQLAIDEEQAKLVRLIFDKYAHTGMGYSGVARWLNDNGYRRPVPANGKYSVFTDLVVKGILDNPVYTGKIVHGRYGSEKIKGTRNEYRKVKRGQYEEYDGRHEAIISDELWEEVRAKRQATAGKQQNHVGPKHVHVLSRIVRCPVCGHPMRGNVSRPKKNSSGDAPPPKLYYTCDNGRRANGRDCTYSHSIREELLDRQVVEVVQQAVDNMYVDKGLIMALGSSDDLEELSANLDALLAEKKKAEKKKSRLLDRIECLDDDDDQYDATFNDLQGILRRHNQSIAELDDRIEEASIRLRSAREGAASFEETLRMFHWSMGSIKSWPAEHLRAFMRNFLEYVEIYPTPLPDGRMVKSIRFKFPVSVDGGLSYSEIVDLDGGDGGTPPEGGPPDGGGHPLPPVAPYDDGDFPINDILPLDSGGFLNEGRLPNPEVLITTNRKTPVMTGVSRV